MTSKAFFARLRRNAATATTGDRQRVLRALVQDILIGPGKITIRHRIPPATRLPAGAVAPPPARRVTCAKNSQLRWGRDWAASRRPLRPFGDGANS
jgi:site-specific DNA recombinase